MSFMDNYFGVATKRKASDELPEQSSAKKQKTPAIACDKWNSSWDKAFPWAEKLEVDGQLRAICAWCRYHEAESNEEQERHRTIQSLR